MKRKKQLPKASNQTEEPELQGYDDAMKDAMSSIAHGVASVSEPEQTPDATIMMPDAEELGKGSRGSSAENCRSDGTAGIFSRSRTTGRKSESGSF